MPTSAPASEFSTHCLELLSVLGPARARRMFGGHGIDVDGCFIAIVTGERLYLKADAQTQAQFEAAGCSPFTYHRRGSKTVALSYWTAPDEAMESPALMRRWARLALDAALRAAAAKARKPVRPSAAKSPTAKPPPSTPSISAPSTSPNPSTPARKRAAAKKADRSAAKLAKHRAELSSSPAAAATPERKQKPKTKKAQPSRAAKSRRPAG